MALPRDTELIETLGAGNFGVVYVARLREGAITRTVVLKVLKANLAENHEALIRARDEAALLARLNHDHIVKVEQLTTLQELPTVVMEHIQGMTLDRIVTHTGPLPVAVALDVAARVASALDAAYHRVPPGDQQPLRVIHRDIKPSNIIVSVSGLVKVLDFGAARGDFAERLAETQSMTIGTPLYMAPETFDGEGAAPSVDVYALGATLFELVAGVPLGLLSVKPSSHARKLAERLNQLQPAELAEHPTQLVALRQLIADALAYNAAERPSARALQDSCRRLIRSMPRGITLDQWAEAVVEPLHANRPVSPPPLDGSLLDSPKNIARMLPQAAQAPPRAPELLPPQAPEPTPLPAPAPRRAPEVAPTPQVGTLMIARSLPATLVDPVSEESTAGPEREAVRSGVFLAALILSGLLLGVLGALLMARWLSSPTAPELVEVAPSGPEDEPVADGLEEDEPVKAEPVKAEPVKNEPVKDKPPPDKRRSPPSGPSSGTQPPNTNRPEPNLQLQQAPESIPQTVQVIVNTVPREGKIWINGHARSEGQGTELSIGSNVIAYELTQDTRVLSGSCSPSVSEATQRIVISTPDGVNVSCTVR